MGVSFSDLENNNISEIEKKYSREDIIKLLDKKKTTIKYDKNNDEIYNPKNSKYLLGLSQSDLFLSWIKTNAGNEWLSVSDNYIWMYYNINKINILCIFLDDKDLYKILIKKPTYYNQIFKNIVIHENIIILNKKSFYTRFIVDYYLNSQITHNWDYLNTERGIQLIYQYHHDFLTNVPFWKYFQTSEGKKWIYRYPRIIKLYPFYDYLSESEILQFIKSEFTTDYFASNECYHFIISSNSNKWISTDEGRQWISSPVSQKIIPQHIHIVDKILSNNPDYISDMILYHKNITYKWLESFYGKLWVDRRENQFIYTLEGVMWLCSINPYEYEYRNCFPRYIIYNLFNSPCMIKCLHQQSFENLHIILQKMNQRGYLSYDTLCKIFCNSDSYKWFLTDEGKLWITKNNHIYDRWLVTKYGDDWTKSEEYVDMFIYIIFSGKFNVKAKYNSLKWLSTSCGKNWLSSQQSYRYISNDFIWNWIVSPVGWKWFCTEDGLKFFTSDVCKKYIRHEKKYIPLTKRPFVKYFKSALGKEFLLSSNGELFVEWFKIWRTSEESKEWLLSDDYEEYHNENMDDYIYQIYNPIMGTVI
jgi:hypothetical protein